MCVGGGDVVNKNIPHYYMGAQEEEHRTFLIKTTLFKYFKQQISPCFHLTERKNFQFYACWIYAFLSSAEFFQSTFSKNSFKNTMRVSNSLDPGQA